MSYLEDIMLRKRVEVRGLKDEFSITEIAKTLEQCTTDVVGKLRRPVDSPLRIIAEHKRRSPSKGDIRPGSDPAEIARMYEVSGASAMSVLTDEVGFGGTSADLIAARAAVSLPILCKDFVVSPLQVMLARKWGADIVLLIVAGLSPPELKRLFGLVEQLGMTALVEVHDAHELHVAGVLGATLIGVNNRDLHSFEVDLALSETLVDRFPKGAVRVSESGIRTSADLRRLRAAGYDAALIGESLMRADHPGLALEGLLAEA
ncbi:MAG: indole-3-glycerol phosphate synthase [Myxococcota bacterium]|jgi:indole-3-glycerol phosphate synthase